MKKMHFAQTKAAMQAEWLGAFSDALVTINPRYSGKIQWDYAKHCYFSGQKAKEAAAGYAECYPLEVR